MSISQIPILAERLSSYIKSVAPGRGAGQRRRRGARMLLGADITSRADEHDDPPLPSPQVPAPLSSPVPASPEPAFPAPSSAPLSSLAAPTAERADLRARPAGGEARQE